MQYRRAKIKGGTYFFTVVTHNRHKIFSNPKNIVSIKSTIQHVIKKHPFQIDAIVLLPDHLHCIWTLPKNDDDYSMRWRLIKNYFTKHYKQENQSSMTTRNEIWQKRFWEHQIRDEADYEIHQDYIHYNPVKHGLVQSPKDWSHSSFHRYTKLGIYDINWGADINKQLFTSIKTGE